MNKLIAIIVFFISNAVFAQDIHINNLINPVSYFVDHIRQLREIKYNLDKYKTVGVVGTSGIGKTQLIRMYCYENKNRYRIIWFFDCNTDIDEQFTKLAKEINTTFHTGIPTSYELSKKEVLRYLQAKEDWLLVFDNLKISENNKIHDLLNWEHNGNVIFSSQDSTLLKHLIKMTKFPKEDCIELVNIILQEKNSDIVNFLVDEFQGYPVLLVQGAQIINNVKGLDLKKYKKMIRESDSKIKCNIELCIKELSLSARKLLKKIALINNNKFSKSFLNMVADHVDTVDDDIYQLSKYLLISSISSDQENPIYEMHDIIAQTIRDISPDDENNAQLNEIIFNVLVRSFPKGVVQKQTTRVSLTFNENLQVILNNTKKFQVEIFKEAKLREEVLLSSLNNRKYNLASAMVEWFEEKDKNKAFVIEKMNDYEKYVCASYLNAIGGYYNFALSNPVKAINYFIRAKEVILSANGYESIKFNIMYQILRTRLDLGQVSDAEQAWEEIIKIYEIGTKNNTMELFDNSFVHVAKTRLLVVKERYQEALQEVDKAINAFKKAAIKDSNVLLESSYQLKIEALNNLSKYKESYDLSKWLYELYQPLLNPDHEILANLCTKMAISQYGLGDYQESLILANKAVNMFMKVRKIEEREIQFVSDIQFGKALMIKAKALAALGKPEESLVIYEKAEAIHNNVYAENLSGSNSLKTLLFEAAKIACEKGDKFWFKHFYGNIKYIFGINILQVKELQEKCKKEIYENY